GAADPKRGGARSAPTLEIAMWWEPPWAVCAADLMARRVRFFSIGSNDLIQYTLAMDRGNERIAHLYEPLEPAILRAIDQTVRAGHAAGIWVGVCGEMAGEPRIASLLARLEVDELSVSPFDAPRVKAAVRSLHFEEARQLARTCLSFGSAPEIRAHLRRVLDPRLPRFLLGEAEGDEMESSTAAPSREAEGD